MSLSYARSIDTALQYGRFLRGWLANPQTVGAIAPSSRALARLMARGLGSQSQVLELGAGTGTLTRGLLDAGVQEQSLALVEIDPRFVRLLNSKYPDIDVHMIDALSIATQLRHMHSQLDCVVSGIPLLLMTRAQRMRLIKSAFTLLKPDGAFHQFTYGARCPVERSIRQRLGLGVERVGATTRNVPPAFVYRLRRLQ